MTAPVDLLDRLVEAGIAATTTDHAVTISQAANTIEAYRKREFAEHIIATDAARDADQATPTTPLELRQQRIIAALSARLGEADAKNMVAARDAIGTNALGEAMQRLMDARSLPPEQGLIAGFSAIGDAILCIEARIAGLKEGMTFRAAVQQCMRTSGNALRPLAWPRGYCFVLSGAFGHLTMPGMSGGPVTIGADEILGPWEVLPMAQVQREAADRAADGVEVQ
jgi:hypothetical protein